MESKDIAVIIGATLVFAVGIANLIVLFYTNKKKSFNSAVTKRRFKYINEYRDKISDFCVLAGELSFSTTREFEKLKYDILLHLNPEYKDWDRAVIKLVMEIASCTDPKDRTLKIEKLVIINQFMLKLEWEGAQIESKNGALSDLEKTVLRNQTLAKLNLYMQDEFKS